MKTFKIKDLVISMEGRPRTKQMVHITTRIETKFCIKGCSLVISDWCKNNYSNPFENCFAGSIVVDTIYTPTCGGTKCGGSVDPTYYDFRDVDYLEELKSMKAYVEEYERILEESLKPDTMEELDMLEAKLNAAINEVKALRKQVK
ncbi:MAG: hypothetical protein JNK77_14250 [Saprospiraceae bacterium]|nr:hypothetical protein [Saprospiraceae bacterium]